MRIIATVIICVIGLVIFVHILETKSVFVPAKEILRTPKELGIPFEDVWLQVTVPADFKIHGWWISREDRRKTILFLHGNAGNISDRLDKINMFNRMGLNVLIIDYQGYGRSEGIPTEGGMYADAQAAYFFLTRDKGIAPDDIFLYGASLGGAAAVDVAAKNPVGGLILDSTFTSARDMARHIFPFVPTFLVKVKLDSHLKIKAVAAPKLFFHSKADDTVPYRFGRKLYEAAAGKKKFVDIEGGHNDGHVHSEDIFVKEIHDFITGQ